MSFAEADDASVLQLTESLANKLKLTQLELNGNKFHPPTEAGMVAPRLLTSPRLRIPTVATCTPLTTVGRRA